VFSSSWGNFTKAQSISAIPLYFDALKSGKTKVLTNCMINEAKKVH